MNWWPKSAASKTKQGDPLDIRSAGATQKIEGSVDIVPFALGPSKDRPCSKFCRS